MGPNIKPKRNETNEIFTFFFGYVLHTVAFYVKSASRLKPSSSTREKRIIILFAKMSKWATSIIESVNSNSGEQQIRFICTVIRK